MTRGNCFHRLLVAGLCFGMAGSVLARDVERPAGSKDIVPSDELAESLDPADPAIRAFRRDLTQFAGVTNGCQLVGGVGYLTGPAFKRADNFKPAANSTITKVKWAGYYRALTTATAGTSAGESFEVAFYSDSAGRPGTLVGGPFTVTPTVIADGTFGAGGPPAYVYEADLPSGVAVTGGDCYWLEIRNTTAGGQRWFWRSGVQANGDSYHYYSSINETGYYIAHQVTSTTSTADLSFCLDIELQSLGASTCPKETVPAACSFPDANGQPRNGATTGFSSNTFGSATSTGGSSVSFQRAEAFRLDTAGAINSVCFYAFFNSFATNVGGGIPATLDLNVTYFANDPLTGFPGAEIASYTVGQPGVTLTHDNINFRIDHPAVNIPANVCHHISISYVSNVNDPFRHSRFIWGLSNSAASNTDSRVSTRTTTGATPGSWSITNTTAPGTGLSFVFNVGNAVLPNCAPPPATNVSCATAAPLTIGGPAVTGNNIGVAASVLPPCGFELIFGPVVWYSLVGDGTTVTVSTCNSSIFGDPVVSAWCLPDGCTGAMNCVGSNDDANPTCGFGTLASTLTFPTVAGQTYYITVSGAGGVSTAFALEATSDNTPANPAAPSCASLARCENSALPQDVSESETCIDSTNVASNTNSTCAGATVYPAFGQIAGGTGSTFLNGATNTRDFDLWLLPTVSQPTVVTWKINAEFPVFYTFLNYAVDCTSTPTTLASAVRTACFDTFLGEVTLPETGINVLRITQPDFQGLPCPNFNDYRFQINVVALGACCQPATACQIITEAACIATAGSTWTSGGTCSPDPCTASPEVCCRGATCTVLVTGSCTDPAGTAGAFAATATACNAGSSTNPCCYADYNKLAGIEVNDIFDFLNDWFAGSTFADTGSDGSTAPDVNSIFDFLNAWFAGGC